MKRHYVSLLIVALFLASCAGATDTKTTETKTPVTIDGNWVLATIQSAPISAIPNSSGSMTVTGTSAYTRNTTLSGTAGTETGTVALKSGSVYTFTATGGATVDYTLSVDGKTISGTSTFLGPHTYTK